MVKRVVSLRLDDDLWGALPSDNKSEWIRDILKLYVAGDLYKGHEYNDLERDYKHALNDVEKLTKSNDDLYEDKKQLRIEIERYREIYLPKPKKWWKWWR